MSCFCSYSSLVFYASSSPTLSSLLDPLPPSFYPPPFSTPLPPPSLPFPLFPLDTPPLHLPLPRPPVFLTHLSELNLSKTVNWCFYHCLQKFRLVFPPQYVCWTVTRMNDGCLVSCPVKVIYLDCISLKC